MEGELFSPNSLFLRVDSPLSPFGSKQYSTDAFTRNTIYEHMKPLVLYSIIGASALAVGAGGGVIYKRCFVAPSEKIIGFDPDNCKPDVDKLIADVEKVGNPKQVVQKFRPFEVATYAFEKYKRCEYSVSVCSGLAKTIINQEVRSAQVKRGSTYFEEQISKSSMVGVAKRMIQEGDKDVEVKVYNETSSDAVNISGDTIHASYKSNPDIYSYADYKAAWGRNLPDMSIHLIGETTVENEKLENVDGGYKITLDLQPQKGGYNYRYQMKTISGLDDYPSFQYLAVTFYITENLVMKALNEQCKYHALMGVSVDIENNIDYYYFPQREYKIPNLNEDFDYSILKEGKK